MPKYKITYTVPAEVLLTFEVEANSQSEALIEGYDLLGQAKRKPASFKHVAELLSLDTNAADARSAERLTDEPAVRPDDNPPSPLSLRTDFEVRFYSGENARSTLVHRKEHLPYDVAQEMASNLTATGPFGYAEVINGLTKSLQFHNRAPRGGWEIHTTSHSDETTVERTWISDEEAARREAIHLLLSRRFKKVAVFDFTSRERGPMLNRELQ